MTSGNSAQLLLRGHGQRKAVSRALTTVGVAFFALALLSAVSCDLGLQDDTGSMEVNLDSVSTLSLLPSIDMTVDSYRLEGSGPDGATFTETTTGSSIVLENLATGTWTVTVIGVNPSGTDIASGSGQTDVTADSTASVSVTVQPYEGTGSLDVSVTWPSADVDSPSVEGSLIASDGTSQSLSFTVDSTGTASYSSSSVSTGYYTLSVQLTDGGTAVAGAAETTRVAESATTSGSIDFTSVNEPSGDVDVTIDPDLDQPLDVTLSGTTSSIALGGSMTVSASVSNADGQTISYDWYLNGAFQSTSDSITVGSSLDPGTYRLDVIAFTDDGTRSGSASHTFTVTE